MSPLRLLLLARVIAAITISSSFSAPTPVPPPAPVDKCLAPAAFISVVSSAGDWVVERSPHHVPDAKVTGVIFRHSGMIDVALFRGGCLAMIVVVGEAPPDLLV